MAIFKRADWLKELHIGMGFVTAALSAFVLFLLGTNIYDLIVGGRPHVPITVEVPGRYEGSVYARAGGGLSDRAGLSASGTVEVEIRDPSGGEYALNLLTWLPTAAVSLTVAAMLFILLRHARRHDPFTRWTVRWLRAMGAVILVGGVTASFTDSVANFLLSAAVLKDGQVGTMPFPWGWMLGGLVVLAIADVMARGQRLREDLDGVI